MKKVVFILFIALASLAGRAQALFDTYSHSFGQIRETDGVVEHKFSYKNEGKDPLVILDVSVSCGCTTPSYSVKPLAAGGNGTFTVRFDPTDRPGRFEKFIYLRTTAGEVKLVIEGQVIPRPRTVKDDFPFLIHADIRLSSLALNVDHAPLGRKIVRILGVANSSMSLGATFDIDSAQLPSWLGVKVKKKFLAPGERGEVVFEFTGNDFGLHQADIVFTINAEPQAEKIWVSAVFTRDFSTLTPLERRDGARAEFSSYFYHFSDQKLGATMTRKFEIRNSGKMDLVIDRLESSSKEVTFAIDKETIKAGGKAVLTITVCPQIVGVMSETVRVVSNDSQNPVREVRVMANVI
ncbi:MAG: DUF1573 domain-containing protein [Mucinivorans sp.]